MGDKSKIEWTDATWNPTTGCSRVSAGCDHCYAMGMAKRIQAMGTTKAYDGTTRDTKRGVDWTGLVHTHDDRLDQPLRWQKPRMIFVNSMSDLFHPSVPFEFVDKVFAVMALAPQHIFQVLTKRPERMAEYLGADDREGKVVDAVFNGAGLDARRGSHLNRLIGDGLCYRLDAERSERQWPLSNVWLGTSVEHQDAADERIPHLLRCDAAVRFLSCEPLLGPIDLDGLWGYSGSATVDQIDRWPIHWVIVGGESGPSARPMHPAWARSLCDQCQDAGVAFFFKQWGAHTPSVGIGTYNRDAWADREPDVFVDCATGRTGPEEVAIRDGGDWQGMWRVGKHAAGRELDRRTWNEMPIEVPA